MDDGSRLPLISAVLLLFAAVFFAVAETAFALGERFKSWRVTARAVGDIGYATHGWRLAKEVAA